MYIFNTFNGSQPSAGPSQATLFAGLVLDEERLLVSLAQFSKWKIWAQQRKSHMEPQKWPSNGKPSSCQLFVGVQVEQH